MPRNIFIIGPQCTGKTTLVLQLEKLMSSNSSIVTIPPVIIHEVVRKIMKEKHFSANDFGTERWIELQRCTLDAQIETEQCIGKQWFISDRSVLDPIVYAQLRPGLAGTLGEPEGWKIAIQRMREGLVVLCEAGQRAWLSSDATRIAFADIQQWKAMNERFKSLLQKESIPFHLLSLEVVSLEERVEFVLTRLCA